MTRTKNFIFCPCGNRTLNEVYCSRACRNKYRKVVYSKSHNEKVSLSKMGEKNPVWKGDKVSYSSLHEWIQNHKPKLEFCENCNKNKPFDLANISGEYKRDVNDFKWLCRSCHMKEDGRLNNLRIVGQLYQNSRRLING